MIKKFGDFINENVDQELAGRISSSIDDIDDSMSYKDLASAVAKVIKDDYGSHNYEPFIEELMKQLGI